MTRPRPLALSPSRAGDYQQCPLLYRFRAIDRLPEPKTVAQVKGTLVHAVLEEMHKLPRQDRLYPAAVKRLKPNWTTMCQADPELTDLVSDADLYDFLVECRALLRGYFEMENPQGFDAHECEMYVDTVLPNGVPVRGFIDRVDIAPTGQVRVVDYKTGKKPKPQWSQQAQFQMRFYALVYWRLFDLGDLWAKIEGDGRAGTFRPKTSKLCGWCPHQALCPAFGGTPPDYPGWPGSTAD